MPHIRGPSAVWHADAGARVLEDIVETFVSALGPFADAGVVALARRLPATLGAPDDLRALMQAQRRSGVRAGAVLVAVVGNRLVIHAPQGDARTWPRSECALSVDRRPLGGARLTIGTGEETLVLTQAMPVDEAPRLAWTLSDAAAGPGELRWSDAVAPHSLHPPIARLGSAATLYDDRISFADGPTHPLGPEVVARALELPASAAVLRPVSLMMRGAYGKPRHVLIDGPGWSRVASAPASTPGSADAFAEMVNRTVRGDGL